jgi:hypothetical protein
MLSAIGQYVLVNVIYIFTECTVAEVGHQKSTDSIVEKLNAHVPYSFVLMDHGLSVIVSKYLGLPYFIPYY